MIDTRPYLISVATRVPSDVMYYGTVKNLENSVEFRPVVLDKYPGNLERFFNIPDDLALDRMVIWTDTADVLFQCPIPKLEDKIYVTPEFGMWDQNEWFTPNLQKMFPDVLKDLGHTGIINAGTFAMPGYKLMELVEFIKKNAHRMQNATWGDQPLFNLWLKTQPLGSVISQSNFMTCLYESWKRQFTANSDGLFVNEYLEPISIVHGNGDTRPLLTRSKFLLEDKIHD